MEKSSRQIFSSEIFLVIGKFIAAQKKVNFLINVNLFKILSAAFRSLSLSLLNPLSFLNTFFSFSTEDNVDLIHKYSRHYFIRSDLTILNGPLPYLTSVSEKCLKF